MTVSKTMLGLALVWAGTLYLLQETKLLSDLVIEPHILGSMSDPPENDIVLAARLHYAEPVSTVVVDEEGTVFPYPHETDPLDQRPYRVVTYKSSYDVPPLKDHMIVEERTVVHNASRYPLRHYYAVVGTFWVGLVLWPGLYLSNRLFMVSCSHYQTKEYFEKVLCVVFSSTAMAIALCLVATKQELEPVSDGLRFAALAAVVPASLILCNQDATHLTSMASIVLYAWHFSSPPRPRYGLEFTDSGLGTFYVLLMVLTAVYVTVNRATRTHIIEYAFRTANDEDEEEF